MERTLPGRNFENLGILRADVHFFWKLRENAVKFATRSCWKFKAEVLVEWESAHYSSRSLSD